MNHLKIYLLKEWFVTNRIKIKMAIGFNEIEKIDKDKFIKKDDKTPVIVGPPESMSKSKKYN